MRNKRFASILIKVIYCGLVLTNLWSVSIEPVADFDFASLLILLSTGGWVYIYTTQLEVEDRE